MTTNMASDEAGPDLDDGPRVFQSAGLAQLFDALGADGYTLVGPTVRDGAIVYDEIGSPAELPVGMTDEQEAGHYSLLRRGDGAYFGYAMGPQSWKRFLFRPRQRLYSIRRDPEVGFRVLADPPPEARPMAFIGVRGCEIAAISVQDTIFVDGPFSDPRYAAARKDVFIVGVNCVGAAATCFCVSMKTGPQARGGDLALTEVVTPERHYLVATAGSPRGRAVLARVENRAATADELDEARSHEARATHQVRKLDTHGLKERIWQAQDHPHWEKVAERCLSCANCTLVCPTCFCSSVEDVVDVTGEHAERWTRWDSCFNPEHSELHGHPVRGSIASRYRQWLTHKLSTWFDQFDTSGCVGCGRCIAFCPVGIDITVEAAALGDKPAP